MIIIDNKVVHQADVRNNKVHIKAIGVNVLNRNNKVHIKAIGVNVLNMLHIYKPTNVGSLCNFMLSYFVVVCRQTFQLFNIQHCL